MFGKEKMNSQMLTDITRGIHHAVNTTGQMISQQYVMQLQQFFDTQEDGSLAAKMVKVQVDDQHDMYVPLIALVQPQGIALDKMRFELSVQITESELKRATHEVDGFNAERVAFRVNLSPKTGESPRRRTDIVDVEMEFTRCDAPEGMHRLIEQYANMIQPFKNGATAPEPNDEPQGEGPLKSAHTSARKVNIVSFNTRATGELDKDNDE
ncbi:DUF2589 domain-containing protein [Pseudoalteromonas sp. SSDWG2]|uniref:DUF2589 domain-containing protein n=1 Tax=Pseudoalteromonas sp. SSDWG2 TaxID=3139391 RepID=UPI003BAA721A